MDKSNVMRNIISDDPDLLRLKLNGKDLKEVRSFEYLESAILASGDRTRDG